MLFVDDKTDSCYILPVTCTTILKLQPYQYSQLSKTANLKRGLLLSSLLSNFDFSSMNN